MSVLTYLTIVPTLNQSTGNISVNDTTPYDTLGFPTDGSITFEGRFNVSLISATGTSALYTNIGGTTPDIDIVGSTQATLCPLPLDGDGNILPGTYIIMENMIIKDNLGVTITEFTQTFTYVYEATNPEVCLAAVINCAGSTITSYDSTDYGAYVTTLARIHNLYPPANSGGTLVTGTGSQLVAGPSIYSNTWVQEVKSTVTYTYPDGLVAILYLVGSRDVDVVCDTGLSKLYCCIQKLMKRYDSLLSKNPVAALAMNTDTVEPTKEAVLMYQTALMAGSSSGADYWYNQIVERSGCGDDCGCNSSEPQIITPTTGQNNSFVVDSPDNSITVVPEVVGSTTTYHLQISAAFQTLLASLFSTTVSTGTPSWVTITQTGSTPVRNYQIDVTPNASANPNLIVDEIQIGGLPASANYISYVSNNIVNTGAAFQPAGSRTTQLGQANPNLSTDLAVITISGILNNVLTGSLSVMANVMQYNTANTLNVVKDLECEVFHTDSGNNITVIRLYNPQTGQIYTLADIAANYGTILINLEIKSI